MRRTRHGFTLVELLTVIVIIALLAALAFPSFAAARTSANRARTKVTFSQWTAAIESFRAEYGYYPQFAASGKINDGAASGAGGDHLFHDLLAGRHRDGSALVTSADPTTAAGQNTRLISFHVFGENELNPAGLLQDAFGHTELVVLVDADLDGVIKPGADFARAPSVHAADGSAIAPGATDLPAGGVHAGVVFYAADPTASAANPAFVFSWK